MKQSFFIHLGVVIMFLAAPFLAAGGPPANDLAYLRAAEQETTNLVERLSPQVVAITAWRETSPEPEHRTDKSEKCIPLRLPVRGSGCIISGDGEILTSEHVIRRTREIRVMLNDGREYEACIAGSDPRSDLAVLKIKAQNLVSGRFNPRGVLRRGQWVLAMGNPLGLAFDGQSAVSMGIISSVGRHIPDFDRLGDRYYGNLILTTAPISIGNSGGPLFNLDGEIIGINAIISLGEGGGCQLSFAVPIDEWTVSIIDRLRKGQPIEYGYIGMSLLTQSGKAGPVVGSILENTPAARAGIRPNDIILTFNGKKIKSVDHLILLIGQTIPGKKVILRIVRDGKAFEVTLTAARRKDFVHKDQ